MQFDQLSPLFLPLQITHEDEGSLPYAQLVFDKASASARVDYTGLYE